MEYRTSKATQIDVNSEVMRCNFTIPVYSKNQANHPLISKMEQIYEFSRNYELLMKQFKKKLEKIKIFILF